MCDSVIPSRASFTGILFSVFYKQKNVPPLDDKHCLIEKIVKRVFITLVLTFTTLLDAACLAGMLVLVYPAYRMGMEYIINVIAVIAFPIFALKILFGGNPRVDVYRGFFNPLFSTFPLFRQLKTN